MTPVLSEPERRIRRMTGHDSHIAAQWFREQHPVLEPLSSALPGLLKTLIETRVITAACVERRTDAHDRWEMDAFGLSAFMTDDAVRRYYDDPPAFLDMLLLDRCRNGETAACFMQPEAIAKANAGPGLNLFGLCWLQSTYDYQSPAGRKLLEMGFQIMIGFHRGYRLQRAMLAGWTDYEDAIKAAGFTDLKRATASGDAQYLNHPNQRTRLYGCYTAADAQRQLPGSPVSYLFSVARPVFGLTAVEQAVVELALIDLADAGIAKELNTTVTAVQQRWKRIYQRIGETKPELLGDAETRDDAVRGSEKRRLVLNYVREHPEELRPYDPN